MSLDNTVGTEPLTPTPTPTVELPFFQTSTRTESEAGVWSLLLVPVLICVALVLFVALVPH